MGFERAIIFGWICRAGVALLAAAGLLLIAMPDLARGLWQRPPEAGPPPAVRQALAAPVDELLLASAGVKVAGRQVEQNTVTWRKLGPQQQLDILERYRSLESLDPAELAELAKRYQQFQGLTPLERSNLVKQSWALDRFKASLGRQDLAVLDGLSPRARADKMLELHQARQGLR